LGFFDKKNGLIALIAIQAAYLLGVFNSAGLTISSGDFPFLGVKVQYVMAAISAVLLWLVYDTFGTR
jgi:membrane protein implicated in regulation of membrane protease activity